MPNIIIIAIISSIHFVYINRLEKCMVNSFINNEITKRPNQTCDYEQCYGMPSGHAEFITILSYLLYKEKIINIPVMISLISIVSLQRILAKRHTVYQVLVGIGLGFLYGCIYANVPSYLCILIPFIIILLISFIIVKNIDQKMKTPLPYYVPPELYEKVNQKQSMNVMFKILDLSLRTTSFEVNKECYYYLSWKQLENMLDNMSIQIDTEFIDVIIGIKTGGAILATYLALKLNKPYGFIKAVNINYTNNIFQTTLEYFKRTKYKITEYPNVDYINKNVLLVDETVGRGITIKTSKKYLLDTGATSVTTFAIDISACSNKLVDIKPEKHTQVVIWPWGYDN